MKATVKVLGATPDYNKIIGDVPVGNGTLNRKGLLRVRISENHYLFVEDGECSVWKVFDNVSDRGREVEVDIVFNVKG